MVWMCSKKYNKERGEKLAEVKQTATGETIVAICDSFTRRVHENIPALGDMLIMDATTNLDRNDTKLFHLMCPSPVGSLITTSADNIQRSSGTVYNFLEGGTTKAQVHQ